MSARLSRLLPLAVAALALGGSSAWTLSVLLLPLLGLPFAAGPRFDVDTGRQALSSAIGAGAGYVLASLAYEADPGRLTEGWARLAAGALLAAAARATLLAPRGGYLPTAALGFLGLAFAGKAPNPGYPLFVAFFLLSLPGAFGDRAARLPSGRRAAAGLAVIGLTLLLGASSLSGLQRLRAWARERSRFTTALWQPRTGFSERMDLGALDGLLDSDRRVLRVRGGRVDYLRGASLDVYEFGTWRRSEVTRETPIRLSAAAPDATLEITLLGGRTDRLFLPLGARSPSATPSAALSDDLGSIRAATPAGFESVRFSLGARDLAPVIRPRPVDLEVPRRMRPHLTALVREWTRGLPDERDEAAVLHALERHLLHDFEYARHVSQSLNTDPVLDFLLRGRRGHCEYFASSLALLARAAGIPARVVMGYRVSERSPFGHYVVRERNAHAWVEAWLDGSGWSTEDATPEEAQPFNREHETAYSAASADALAMGYDELTDWLGQRSLLETSLAWIAGCAVLTVIVARGLRGRRRRAALADDEALLAFMQPLLAALEREGHARGADEPLERLASRLPYPAAADVLLRYAALRYGGLGDRDAIARQAEATTRALREGPRAP